MTELAQAIYGARKRAQMSLTEAATLFGVETRTLQRWESGESTPGKAVRADVDAFIQGGPEAVKALRAARQEERSDV